MALPDFKTHFTNHYMKKIANYLLLRKMSDWGILVFFVTLYLSIPLALLSLSFFYVVLTIALMSGVVFLLARVYIFLRPQKIKDVLAYHFLKASDFFQAYFIDQDQKAKKRFLEKCLSHVREAGELLKETVGNARISLDLPNLRQLEVFQINMMNRIYPLIQDGRNTSDDILVSLSRIFFYENEYENLPDLNATIEQALQPRTYEERKWHVPARIKENVALRCAVGIVIITFLIFAGIYILKYPTSADYWQYVGQNAATVAGTIVASSVAISVFIFSRRKPKQASESNSPTG